MAHVARNPPSALLAKPSQAVTYACEASPARIIDAAYPPRTDFDTHEHEEAFLCLAVRGSYDEWCGGARRTIVAGRDLVCSEGSRHAVRTGSRGVRLLHVTDPRGSGWREGLSPLSPGLLWQLAIAVDDLADESATDADRLHVESLVFELSPERTSSPGAVWLDSVRERLREGYSGPVSLGALAHELGRHPAHLARSFKSASGMTPGEYVRRLRVAAAIRLLRETDRSPAAVAVQVGFSDQSHMGRWLRRYLRKTPGEIRRGAASPRR